MPSLSTMGNTTPRPPPWEDREQCVKQCQEVIADRAPLLKGVVDHQVPTRFHGLTQEEAESDVVINRTRDIEHWVGYSILLADHNMTHADTMMGWKGLLSAVDVYGYKLLHRQLLSEAIFYLLQYSSFVVAKILIEYYLFMKFVPPGTPGTSTIGWVPTILSCQHEHRISPGHRHVFAKGVWLFTP